MLSDREKIGHLLRRFGLGAGKFELSRYEPLGVKGTIASLLRPEKKPDIALDPWTYCWNENKPDPNSYHIASWWSARFLMTDRPLEEKMTLFWHDHFALDGEKVGEAPMMIGYLEVLRKHGFGNFETLLIEVLKQGGMLGYLDQNLSSRLEPNENLGRELLELFTLGEGNYTEKDVKEVSRALTGWTLHYLGTGGQTDYTKLRDMATKGRMALMNVCYVPAMHDAGSKTILGKTANFDLESVAKMLAVHPQTARYMCRKLWEFFAYQNPEPALVDRLANVWKSSNGEIRKVLEAITAAPEFWSERCVRQMPKSPVDWSVALFRCLNVGEGIRAMAAAAPKDAPIKKELREGGDGINYLMTLQGLRLLYPPNVSGWEWYEGWISSQTTMRRVSHSDVIFWGGGEARPFAVGLAAFMKTMAVKEPVDIVNQLADVFDMPLSDTDRETLTKRCTAAGGVKALDEKNQAANLFAQVSKIMFAMPSAQLC